MHRSRSRNIAVACVFAFSCSKPEPDRFFDASPQPIELPALGVLSVPDSSAPVNDYVTLALKSPKIVVLGDSIVHGSNELVARTVGQTINSGYDSGQFASVKGVTKGGQLVRGWIGYQFGKQVTDKNNNIIVLEGGVNDIGWWGKLTNSPVREDAFIKLIAKFGEMIQSAIDNKKVLVLVTVSPWKDSPYWSPEGQKYAVRLNDWMKSQASHGVLVADTYSALEDCREKDYLAKNYRGGDIQHPNDAGKRVIGERIAGALGFAVSPYAPASCDVK
jgi:lysophospholipase L1-like esterase